VATNPIALSPAVRRAAETALADIAEVLEHPPPPHDGDKLLAVSLLSNEPGYALFYSYLDRLQPAARHRKRAQRYLARAMATLPKASGRPFFSYGFTGASWAFQHLAGWMLDIPPDGFDDIDAALCEIVERAPTVSFDIQHGLAGFGIYALERLPAPGAQRLLALIVERLGRMAEPGTEGTTWRMVNAQWVEAPYLDQLARGMYDPGVFNGVAGIAGVLGGAIGAGIAARPLLEGALRWTWYALRRMPKAGMWMDGALGIAAVTHAAARRAGLASWEERAHALALAIARAAPRMTQSGLARGAAGAAVMFARLYRTTGEPRFADAAITYLERLLRRRRPGEGLAGYRWYSPVWQRGYVGDANFPTGWIGTPGLLVGVTGIGLALLAFLDERDPAWDRALLLSHR
jgi:hypothetical protein